LRSRWSGFLLSVPGRASHDTTPHKRSLQLTILMRAICLSTSHSPVGSDGGLPAGCAKVKLAVSREAKTAAQSSPFLRIAILRCCTRVSLAGSVVAPGINNANQRPQFKFDHAWVGGTLYVPGAVRPHLLTVGLQNVAAGLLQFFPVVLQAGQHAKCVRENITTISDGVRTACSLFLGCTAKQPAR
jgi:hypothetical protein